MQRVVKELASWAAYIVSAVLIGLAINTFVFQPTQIIGCSMESTFYENDKIMVNKLIHTFGSVPEYGDVVIIDSRVNRSRTLTDDLTDSLKYNAITSMITKENKIFCGLKELSAKLVTHWNILMANYIEMEKSLKNHI